MASVGHIKVYYPMTFNTKQYSRTSAFCSQRLVTYVGLFTLQCEVSISLAGGRFSVRADGCCLLVDRDE